MLRPLAFCGALLAAPFAGRDVSVDPAPAPRATTPVSVDPAPAPRVTTSVSVGSVGVPPSVAAVARSGPVVVDGRLDDAAWDAARPATDFRQHDPDEGAPATQRTEVRFLYDGDALYVGARMFDSGGAAGVRSRLARRDGASDADYLMLVLDTYHDHTGRIVLRISPSGVQYDALAAGSADPDPAWDAVWESATGVDSLGWTAELRIPFAELRMPSGAPQTWGLQIWRYEQRLNETSQWSFWSKRDAGGPPAFGHLTGIVPIARPLSIDALPFAALSRRPRAPAVAGTPTAERTAPALGSDLLLRARGASATVTIEPDFGQVEVDPAVLNLTASETFFPEKRPFFVQDAGVLAFGDAECLTCAAAAPLRLYYSRRIGRPPSLPVGGRVVELPTETRVLGAARLTAQSLGGWTVGVLGARTAAEHATVLDSAGRSQARPIEPAATELVARATRRARGGDASVGLTATSLARDVGADASGALAAYLPATARAAGADADRWWSDRTFHASAIAAATEVDGTPAALARVQRSSVHYFQRPGRRAAGGLFDTRYDTMRSRLRGFAGEARLARDAGSWTWEAIAELLSGGFEANDLGYVPRAGTSWLAASIGRALTTPTRWYHEGAVTAGTELLRNEDGDAVEREWHLVAKLTTRGYWTVSATHVLLPARYDDHRLRGGPTVGIPSGHADSLEIGTDTRRAIAVDVRAWLARRWGGDADRALAPTLTMRPADAVTLSLGAELESQRVAGQLVTVADGGTRWVVSSLEEHTAALQTRASIALSPTLTVDAFVQPFLTAGRFVGFGEYVAPRASRRLLYGRDIGTSARTGTDSVVVDPDGPGPSAPFTFADPSGATRSLRGSSVLRWEYRPGAALSLAWTQTRLDDDAASALSLPHDGAALLRARPTNAFVVKLTYRVAR